MRPIATLPYPIRNGDDYLDVLQSLSRAVEDGLTALATGHMAEFKEQLGRQEDCCYLLLGVGAPDATLSRAQYTSHGNNQELDARILTAHKRLSRLNYLYRALLRHSARSVDVLAAHCQTYLQSFGDGGDSRSIDKVLLAEA
jgi:hypothetical protein